MAVNFERRSGQDRRRLDISPVNGKERRLRIEPRKTTVVEMSISEVEWACFFGSGVRAVEIQIADYAAAILERARDD